MESAVQQRGILSLVEKLTDKSQDEIDEDATRRLKLVCKQGGSEVVGNVFRLLVDKLRTSNSKIRLNALRVFEVLVPRSAVFRNLMAQQISELVELMVGYKTSAPLPPPSKDAAQLREFGLACIEEWSQNYGGSHQQIRMGHRYLKSVLKMKFPEVQAQQAAREAEVEARQERSRQINMEKYARLCETYLSTIADIHLNIDELESMYKIVNTQAEPITSQDGNDEWEDVQIEPESENFEDSDMRKDTSRSLNGNVKDGNQGNANSLLPLNTSAIDDELIGNMRIAYKLLTGRHLTIVQDWLKLVIKVDVGEPGSIQHRRRETILRKAIRTRDAILECKSKYDFIIQRLKKSAEESQGQRAEMIIKAISSPDGAKQRIQVTRGTSSPSNKSFKKQSGTTSIEEKTSETELLETVFGSDSEDENLSKKAAQVSRLPNTKQSLVPVPALKVEPRQSPLGNLKGEVDKKKILEERKQALKKSNLPESIKARLLKEAPSVPTGTHLAYWDSDKASLVNNKGMEFYNHWGAVDESVPLPDDVISKFFTTRATYYEPSKDGKKRVREDAKDAKEGDNNETIEEEPPKKKIPKVTKIGGDLTSIAPLSFNVGTLSGPKMEKFVPPPRRPESLITPPKSEKNASTPLAGNSRLMEWNDGGKETQLSQNEGSNGNESSESKQKKVQETQRISESKKSAKERKASQQALDRRHNERILAGSLYQDPDEPTKEATKKKDKPSVRDRLARKLLSGKAQEKAVGDLDRIQNENFKDMESQRWAEK